MPYLGNLLYNPLTMPFWNHPQRPQIVTITLWGVFVFGVWHLGQAIAIGRQLRLFLQFEGGPDPRLRLGVAVVWVILAGWVGVLLWGKRPFVRILLPLVIISHALYNLFILTQFAQVAIAAPIGQQLFSIALVALFSRWALHSQQAKQYFTEGD